jgi:hypothetical protein
MLPDLALWLDATHDVEVATTDAASPPVTLWRDRSINHRDAVPIGMGTSAPTLVAAGIGGQPVVHFDAAAADLLKAQWNGPGGTEITLFLVADGYPTSAVRFQTDISVLPVLILPLDVQANPANPSFYFYVATTDAGVTTTTATRLLLSTSPELITARWQADGTASTYRNGVLVEQRVALDPSLPANIPLFLGGGVPEPSAMPYSMNGDIAEVVVYAIALDDMARTEVEGYLRSKWSL